MSLRQRGASVLILNPNQLTTGRRPTERHAKTMQGRIEAPWAKVPLHVAADPEITFGDLRVYIAIDYLAGKRGYWYGPQEQIAQAAGVSMNTCQRAVERLRTLGHLSTVKMGLKEGLVLRYMVHARTLPADGVNPTDGVESTPPVVETVNPTYGADNTTDLPQTSPQTQPTTTGAPSIFSLYRKCFGREANALLGEKLYHVASTHPSKCVAWVFETISGLSPPSWKYAEKMLMACDAEGHGPRERKESGNGVSVRARSPRSHRAKQGEPDLAW